MQTLQQNRQSSFFGVRARMASGLAILSVPLLLFSVISIITSVNIPYLDDYDSIGSFVEDFVGQHGLHATLRYFFATQHVQYKLFSLETIVLLQHYIEGDTNYRVLQLLGDLAVPATVLMLWLIFARNGRPLLQRIWLFIIPCYVFFSIRYAETVNWTMSGLQNLGILPVALATIYFATSSARRSTLWTAICLVLSIATSGNGFFVAIIVIGFLLAERRPRAAILMAALTAIMAGLYAFHYHVFNVYQQVPLRAAVESLLLYPFAFLGNCATSPQMAVALGAVLVAGFVLLTGCGWYRVCPASFGSAVFCLITAVGVALTRYRAGIGGALAGHYVMYSLLFIALEYIAVVRLFAPPSFSLRSRSTAALALAGVASFAFCLWADAHAYRELHARKKLVIAHLILWERHPDHLVLVPDGFTALLHSPEWIAIRTQFQNSLQSETAKGFYKPPFTASDPLPIRPHSPATLGIEDEPPPPANK